MHGSTQQLLCYYLLYVAEFYAVEAAHKSLRHNFQWQTNCDVYHSQPFIKAIASNFFFLFRKSVELIEPKLIFRGSKWARKLLIKISKLIIIYWHFSTPEPVRSMQWLMEQPNIYKILLLFSLSFSSFQCVVIYSTIWRQNSRLSNTN